MLHAADFIDELEIGTQDSNCFLAAIFVFFCLLSSRILQNNLLDLYLVEIRRYKLSFFAKQVTNTSHVATPFFQSKTQNSPGAGTRRIIG